MYIAQFMNAPLVQVFLYFINIIICRLKFATKILSFDYLHLNMKC